MVAIVRAIDVGYGNTKFVLSRDGDEIRCGMFPSLSSPSLSHPVRTTLGERRKTVVIPVQGMHHEVGPDAGAARDHFRPVNMHDSFVETPAYRAFVGAALTYMKVSELDVLVLGLPVAALLHKKTTLERRWVGEHQVAEG